MGGVCEGRVVIVTGAGRGIGRSHALAFASEGAKVVVNDLGVDLHGGGSPTSDSAEAVVEDIRRLGGQAISNGADVADYEQVGALFEQTLSKFSRVDVVVNNAGFVRDRMFVSTTEDEWDAVLRVHLKGHFCLSRHAAGWWRQRAKSNEVNQARIINTSSGAGLLGSVGQSAYSAAKAAIANLTIVQSVELARYGVTVNAIAPAARTRMTETVFSDMMKVPQSGFDAMHPDNISPLVVWLGSVESAHVTGRVFEVAGGEMSLADPWRPGPKVDKGRRWEVSEVSDVIDGLIAQLPPAPKAYGQK